jgi:hypothetical protein
MTVLKIIDIINTPNAILHSFGLKVFEVASESISKNQSVVISFQGLKNITSAFCNASIGKLYLSFPKTSELLFFEGLENNTLWKEKVQSSIELALNPEKREQQNQAISDLLFS